MNPYLFLADRIKAIHILSQWFLKFLRYFARQPPTVYFFESGSPGGIATCYERYAFVENMHQSDTE